MPPDSLDGLEDVHFAVLDDLLDAGVGGAVHPGAAASVPAPTRHINTYYNYTYTVLKAATIVRQQTCTTGLSKC